MGPARLIGKAAGDGWKQVRYGAADWEGRR
jgi:hypothetical protein